jgi:hypothetical protein
MGVATKRPTAELGAGVTVIVAGLLACPPNVAMKLVTNASNRSGAT